MRKARNVLLVLSLFLIGFTLSANVQSKGAADNNENHLTPEKLEKIYHPKNYQNDFEPGVVIVELKSAVTTQKAPSSKFLGIDVKKTEELAAASKSEIQKAEKNSTEVKGTELVLTLENNTRQGVLDAIDILKENPDVKYAQPNYIYSIEETASVKSNTKKEKAQLKSQIGIASTTPNDPRYSDLWGLQKINMPSAWDLTQGSTNVKIGVLDTGIDYNHPDLAANVHEEFGYDAYDNNFTDFMDTNGHGTHVAGTIGAKGNNAVGVAGVNWNSYIVPVKIADNTQYAYSDSITLKRALLYSENIGLDIVNISYSFFDGGGYDPAVEEGLNYFSGLVVGAAGNSNSLYNSTYNCDNLILVGNSTQTDGKATDSSYGEAVDVFAPGTNILSTTPGNNYGLKSGTSMAAPHVTGAAALLKAHKPSSTNTDIIELIRGTATESAALKDKCESDGVLDAARLLSDQERRIGDYSFKILSGNNITITYYHGSGLDVTFPSTLDGYDVTTIGDTIYMGNPVVSQSVIRVTIPNSVYTINPRIFDGRTGLQYVKLPTSLWRISTFMFYGCTNLTEVVMPTQLEFMEPYAFAHCTSLQNITIPNSIKELPGNLFYNCSNLRQIQLPSQLEWISGNVFEGCSRLQNITIPAGVYVIDVEAFKNCTGLTYVDFRCVNPPSMWNTIFEGCRSLTTIYVPRGSGAVYRSIPYFLPYMIIER